ncbi:MAG: TetR/AcrR family transcriptional regulator [Anaerococcus sp.]
MREVKDAEIRKEEIMDISFRLFMKNGYMNTTTQDIIDEAKISRGLLYYHFKNKEDILYNIVERYSKPILRKISNITNDTNRTAIDKLRDFFSVTFISLDNITDENIELQKMVDLKENSYLMDKICHEITGQIALCFEKIIRDGNSEKIFNVKYPKETADFLVSGYIFVSNDLGMKRLDIEKTEKYLKSFKILLANSLGIDESIL